MPRPLIDLTPYQDETLQLFQAKTLITTICEVLETNHSIKVNPRTL